MTKLYKAIGLMSGTSLDGIDAALIETNGKNYIEFKGSTYFGYDDNFKARMHTLACEDIPLNDVLRLEKELTEAHIYAVNKLLGTLEISAEEVDIIGFHGQTIRHLPEEGLTWQLGNAQLLAEHTSVPVVADFRRRDMATQGEGAPLVPLFHQALLGEQEKPCAILNIGGVANVTYFGKNDTVFGTDTGPGNGLLDAWIKEKTGNNYDENGALGLAGKIHEDIITQTLETLPFFKRQLPRSADRYDFNAVDISTLSIEDGAATLAALTAKCVAKTLKDLPTPQHMWVTGGGVYNRAIMHALKTHFPQVESVKTLGLRQDSMEAECFAWLAVRHLRNLPFTLPTTTGCAQPTVGGILTK